MRLYRFSALFLAGCCSIVSTTLVAQPRATLTRADIEQAIAWGWTGDPAP